MSFAAGFQLGNRMVADFEDAKRQKVLDERAAKEFARKEQQWAREDSDRARVDQAFDAYNDLSTSGQAVGTNTSGFSEPSARMLYGQGGQAAVDEAASYANVENRRFGLPTTNTTSGVPETGGPPAPTVQMRPATEVDRISALERLATARRDVASMERLGGQRKVAEEDQLYAQHLKGYTGAEDQIGATAIYLNNNSGRITMGVPDKDGLVQLSVVRGDGRAEFLNLPRQDQAKLYAAGKLMERNPTRALEIIGSVNKELAAAVAAENGLTVSLATNANSVADKRGDMQYKRAAIDVQRFNAQTSRQNANASAEDRRQRGAMDRMGAAQYFEGTDGKLYAAIPTMGKGGLEFQTVPVNPDGVGLRRPGSAGGTKPVKVPEAGEKFMVDGRLVLTDGQGGYIDPKGVLPDARTSVLSKAGIPDEALSQLRWNGDGTRVAFGNMAYDVRDPKDLRALRQDIARLAGNTIAVEEANRRDVHTSNDPSRGFGPALTVQPPAGMPNIYTGTPQEWQNYRNQQGR